MNKSGLFNHKKSIIVALALCFALSLLSSPVLAEGYPGMGDRLKYAEALPHYNLGNRYLAKKWPEKAVESYRNAIEIYPFDADVYTNLGIALRRLNDLPTAEWAYKRSIELKGDDWISLSNLANTLMIQDKFQESLGYFEKALKCKDLPPEEKKAILYNIDGIKKIMKNKGMLKQMTKKRSVKAKLKKGKHTSKKRTASKNTNIGSQPGLDEASYDSWVGN